MISTGKIGQVYTWNGTPINGESTEIKIEALGLKETEIKLDGHFDTEEEQVVGTFRLLPENLKEWLIRLFRPKYYYHEYTLNKLHIEQPKDGLIQCEVHFEGDKLVATIIGDGK